MSRDGSIGFEGRVFLHEFEWRTYLRRMPVRYIRRKHDACCEICGLPGGDGNPLEHSHRIGFRVGIIEFALTPEFLDSPSNIVSAHKRVCNRAAELRKDDVLDHLRSIGVDALPEFLHRHSNESNQNGALNSYERQPA